MTRETKIGLLVGLAFIIMIGILISDHVSSQNESPTASLPVAGNTVRGALGEMGGNDDVAPLLRNPVAIAPRQNVPTHEELTRRADNDRVGTSGSGMSGGVTLANPDIVNLNPPQDAEQNAPQNAPPNAATNATQTGPTLHRTQGNPQGETPAERIRREAIARGEDVEPVDGGNNIPAPPKKPTTPAQPQPKAVAAGYKAQSGDTLGTIALRALGANNKANREAIVAANPSLQSNRNLIVAGRVYAVPVMTNGRTPASPSSVQPVDSETVDAPARETNVTYVVQSGDTLWSIAVNELGSPSAVDTIEQLNQDILGDSEQLRPNMKLRLPTKKVATAN